MAVAFHPGQELGRGDLDIFLNNAQGNPTNAAEIFFGLYFVDPGPPEAEVLLGDAQRVPVNPQVGEYYAAIRVPSSAVAGTYRIRWTFREFVNSPQQQVVQEFAVVESSALLAPQYSAAMTTMMNKLRMQIRDNNPDKFYRFRPPEHEGDVGQFNRVFGQIWEDQELAEYIEWAVDWWNMFPPATKVRDIEQLVRDHPEWRTVILWIAVSHACFALMANWTADEFSYSIGGISLDLEKSSKYQSLKDSADQQVDKATEAKMQTVKYIRGLQQPRFGMGVRSAWGPHLGKGVLSPRNFV